MRSEADIRRQVEARLRRWALLALNGVLWIGAAKLVYGYSQYGNFGRFTGVVVVFMLLWASLVGLHVLRTVYVELREALVRRAIDNEMRAYFLHETSEKRKRDDAATRLSIDGELVDFPEALPQRKGRE